VSHDNLGRRLVAEPMPEALKDAIATCYGLLWEVYTDDQRVHRARRGLLQWLTKDEQARGIEMARGVMLLTSRTPKESEPIMSYDYADSEVDARVIADLRAERDALIAAMREAIELLIERKHGNPARSAGHNARLCLESALRAASVGGADRG
jgi:hypothetical protein